MFQHLYLVKIWSNGEKNYFPFFSLTHSGRGAADSGPEIVGGRASCRDGTDAQKANF